MRLGLHPPDYEHADLWRQIRRIVQRAVGEREATTYAKFLHAS